MNVERLAKLSALLRANAANPTGLLGWLWHRHHWVFEFAGVHSDIYGCEHCHKLRAWKGAR